MRKFLIPLVLWATSVGAQDSMTAEQANGLWQMVTLDGVAFESRAELDLTMPGRVAGHAPCNGFSGPQTAEWPAVSIGPLRVTRMACPELAQEHAFLSALSSMTGAELRDDALILRDDAGREMVFTPMPAP